MNKKTFNFTSSIIHSLPFSDKQVIYFDDTKSFKVQNSKLALKVGKRTKSFVFVYRKEVNGSVKKHSATLGKYPEMSLKEARDKFMLEVRSILGQEDEFIGKINTAGITFNDCAEFYINDRKPSKNELTILQGVMNDIGNMPMRKITKDDVLELIKEHRKEGKYHMANYRRQMVQRVWNYNLEENGKKCASFKGLQNPGMFRIKLHQEQGHWSKEPSKVVVEADQIKPLFQSIESLDHADKKDLIKLFFYLGQHPYSEICNMRWDQFKEIDGQMWWLMEKGFHKAKTEHSVPLHKDVWKLIEARKGLDKKYVFVSLNRKDSEGNLLPYVKDNFQKQMYQIREDIGHDKLTFQCFRATVTTKLREMGKGHEPSYLMNQALPGISNKVYTRSDFKPLKVKMVNDWMNFIQDRLNEK